MIIVQIKSGLGNQLFQYACGRALSLRNKDALKLDLRECGKTTVGLWKYRLDVFAIKEDLASPEESDRLQFAHGRISKFFFKVKTKLKMFNISYNPLVKYRKGDVYLNGFWQTERYFDDFREQIRADIRLKEPLGAAAQSIANEIKATDSISVHIRRADYANNKVVNDTWGTCSNDYYLHAIKHIASKIGDNIHVFVFSDDAPWVKENIPFTCPVSFVSSPDIRDHEELMLMSLCKHNVISNSTFGWWGAWLNANPDKIVVAPKRWAKKKNYIYRDIVPKNWTRL